MSAASLSLEIDGVLIPVRPDAAHEWTVSTDQVASGYGVTVEGIRSVKHRHGDELLEGTHFTSVSNCNANPRAGIPHVETRWTKLGVVTLGFFIRSERAKRFRRLAAELMVRLDEAAAVSEPVSPEIAGVLAALAEGFRTQALIVASLDRRVVALEERVNGLAKRSGWRSGTRGRRRRAYGERESGLWMEWLRGMVATQVPAGGRSQFAARDLLDLGAPVSRHQPRPDMVAGQRMARLSGRELALGDGTVAVFFPLRTHLRRYWICERSALESGGGASDDGKGVAS